MKQRSFPFRIPDRVLLEILTKIHGYIKESPSIQDWFYSVMLLLDTHCEVHFGDLVTTMPLTNGNASNIRVISYKKGEIAYHTAFPNSFLTQAFNSCTGKKTFELTEIQIEKCLTDYDLPYCPVVIPLGYCEYHFGVFAAGSYNDKAIIMRNRRLFEILGTEMSLFLLIRYMDQMVSSLLFGNGKGEGDTLGFEDLLTFKFKQLVDKIDPEVGGNILGEIVSLVQRILIRLALEKTGHKLGNSAMLLGINRNTLRKKIKILGLEHNDSTAS